MRLSGTLGSNEWNSGRMSDRAHPKTSGGLRGVRFTMTDCINPATDCGNAPEPV